jgi:hypothetical protein
MGLLDDEEMLRSRMIATPRNQLLGLLSDFVAQSYDPRRTQQMQGMANLFSAPAISETLNRLSYGEPLTTGAGGIGGTTRIRPEALEAGMMLAPMVGPAARLTKGLPVGMSIKDVSYRGSHLAPNAANYGATIDDLGKIMPEDVYSSKGISLYGSGDRRVDSEWFAAAYKAKGNPDKMIEIFRAVPKGVKNINEGDFVTTSRTYAKNHGEAALGGDYDIVSMKVKANTLSSEGYPYEFGYNTNAANVSGGLLDVGRQAPQAEALRLAQQRAALPVEQGGLGLSAGNTPAQRSKAMGFDVDAYHGSDSDILALDKALLGQNTNAPSAKKAFFSAGNPRTTYAYLDEGFTGTDATMISEYGKTFSQIDNQLREISKKTGQSIIDLRNNFFDGPSPTQLRLDDINKTLAPLTQPRRVGLKRVMPPPLDEKQQVLVNKLTNEKEEILAMRQVASTRNMSAGDAIDDTVAYIPPDYKNAGANIMPLRLNVKNAKEYDDMGLGYRADSYSNRIDDALSQGFDSAIIRNTRDGYQPLDDIYAITNPDNIRSRFAAFDPFRRNAAIAAAMGVAAPNLLAKPVNGLLDDEDDDEERRRLSGLLGP